MSPDLATIVNLSSERRDAARSMSFEQRYLAGAELFDMACEVARGHLRAFHPDWTAEQIDDELRRRIAIAEELRARR
jgi:hypothetical protein